MIIYVDAMFRITYISDDNTKLFHVISFVCSLRAGLVLLRYIPVGGDLRTSACL